ADKTQCSIQDHSGNSILMEGRSGGQDIRVNAVKDMNFTVKNDYNETVKSGNRKIDVVVGTHTETIKGDTRITVSSGAYSHFVAANEAERVSQGRSVLASLNANIYLQAATDVTLHVGASTLFMDSDGNITLQGAKLRIEGTTSIEMNAPTVRIGGTNSLELTGATVTAQATGTLNVKGALVKIN
ncbi:MAG: bacteriophage T4 gp5 trimerization domain-containing protein, partial [Bradyrhizobium sp.]